MWAFFFQDIDCMPINPFDNLPEACRRQNIAFDKFSSTTKELQMQNSLNFGGSMMFASSGYQEKTPNSINTMTKHGKVRLY